MKKRERKRERKKGKRMEMGKRMEIGKNKEQDGFWLTQENKQNLPQGERISYNFVM